MNNSPEAVEGGKEQFLAFDAPDSRTQMLARNVHAFQYIKIRASPYIHVYIRGIQSGSLEPTVFFILVFFILKFLSLLYACIRDARLLDYASRGFFCISTYAVRVCEIVFIFYDAFALRSLIPIKGIEIIPRQPSGESLNKIVARSVESNQKD